MLYYLDMSDAAIKHDAQYADFAARMLAALASEEASIASLNTTMTKYIGHGGSNSETVRPTKKA